MANDVKASRNVIVDTLVDEGTFKFAGYIQNEVEASSLMLFKDLARYKNIPFSEANKITTNDKWNEKFAENTYTGWLPDAVEDLGLTWAGKWDKMEKDMQYCYSLKGVPYNSSVHASGVILTVEDSTLPEHDKVITYNGVDIETEGYIKYDILSIDTLNLVQYFYGMDFDWNDNEDDLVWDMIDNGNTNFMFQFASEGMKGIIKSTRPRNITSLAEINALYRPGPIGAGMIEKYTQMKHGKLDLNNNELAIYKILKREFGDKEHSGLVVFQEDVMKLCEIGAGFTMEESDSIRKAMGKKKPELLASYKEKFINNWRYDNLIQLGDNVYLPDDNVTLSDGSVITAQEAYNRVQNNETLDIVS